MYNDIIDRQFLQIVLFNHSISTLAKTMVNNIKSEEILQSSHRHHFQVTSMHFVVMLDDSLAQIEKPYK